ncbi:MAG: raffinose synthase [Candidatus Bathyarchaeota archaeon]|nr:raffinose synthase [Candidatus Bathyarchaeota archaeon]
MSIIIDSKGVRVDIRSVTLGFSDGGRSSCSLEGIGWMRDDYRIYRYRCADAYIDLYTVGSDGWVNVGLSMDSSRNLDRLHPIEVELDAGNPKRILALTTHRGAAGFYSDAFRYYNPIAAGKESRGVKPSDSPLYPYDLSYKAHEEYVRGFPCWTYPVVVGRFEDIPYYSVFILTEYGDTYLAALTVTDGDVTTYIDPRFKLRIFSGVETRKVGLSWITSIAIDNDPYRAVDKCVEAATSSSTFKLRVNKRVPIFMDRLGWCSWNALLTEDLSHDNVLRIVEGLRARGIPIGWVIIDDGWQDEVSGGRWPRRVLRRLSANQRFPRGLRGLVKDLRELGVELVGLWHTINVHWGGFEEEVARELGVDGYRSKFTDSYVPPATMDKAYEFYRRFFSWVRESGFDFVKIDNQWIIHSLYSGDYPVGLAARNVQLAMQLAAYATGLDIVNCMCMAPEDYSYFLFSNAMRVSIDYIPFWKADAKLHTLFSVYNALLFSNVAYPDYDMFISYDPYAKIHLVARVFSGGPVYITDRYPERSDLDTLRKVSLPDGRVVRVDRPGLPTRDLLFRDPYNEPVVLKVASTVKGYTTVALFNVYKDGNTLDGRVKLDILPFKVEEREYLCYRVFDGSYETMKPEGEVNISLKELEAEILILAPIYDGGAVIGLKDYLLPPYPVRIVRIDRELIVESEVPGTLLYYTDGILDEMKIEKGIMRIPR